jgi:hypothetical protein
MTRLRVGDSVVIMKIVLVAAGTLLPILASAGIQYETTQQQTVFQETLSKMCPMVWENIATVRTMPEYQKIRQWCPEA